MNDERVNGGSPTRPQLSLSISTTLSICPEMNRCRHLRCGPTYVHMSPSPNPLSTFHGTQSPPQWGEIRDAVTKYCLSPQDTRSVRGIVTSYIKWLHQTICSMTAHLRHNIIQRDRGGRGRAGQGTEVAAGVISMAPT